MLNVLGTMVSFPRYTDGLFFVWICMVSLPLPQRLEALTQTLPGFLTANTLSLLPFDQIYLSAFVRACRLRVKVAPQIRVSRPSFGTGLNNELTSMVSAEVPQAFFPET